MSNSERRAIGDMKHGLTSSRVKLSILPRAGIIHGARVCEYGADKYARGNFHGPPPATVTPAERVLGYIDAALPDDEASGGFPASGLPHLAHAAASILIGIAVAVDDGLLPADPGQPWKRHAVDAVGVELPQTDDPAAERARVAALAESRAREPGVYDVAEATTAMTDNGPSDPHAALRAEIAAAGLPPAPEEALEGRKLVEGRSGGWNPDRAPPQSDRSVWLVSGSGNYWLTGGFCGSDKHDHYLVPQDWT